MKHTLTAIILMLTASCAPVCEHLRTRCADNVVQLCDSRGQWQNVMDCGSTDPGEWYCEELDNEHTCIEIEE